MVRLLKRNALSSQQGVQKPDLLSEAQHWELHFPRPLAALQPRVSEGGLAGGSQVGVVEEGVSDQAGLLALRRFERN